MPLSMTVIFNSHYSAIILPLEKYKIFPFCGETEGKEQRNFLNIVFQHKKGSYLVLTNAHQIKTKPKKLRLPLKVEQAIDFAFRIIQRLAVCVHFMNSLAYMARSGKMNNRKTNKHFGCIFSLFLLTPQCSNIKKKPHKSLWTFIKKTIHDILGGKVLTKKSLKMKKPSIYA